MDHLRYHLQVATKGEAPLKLSEQVDHLQCNYRKMYIGRDGGGRSKLYCTGLNVHLYGFKCCTTRLKSTVIHLRIHGTRRLVESSSFV